MDLKVLRYFITAVEERSIQRAASRLNMAQPALSRRLRDLEAELGCMLLDRGTRGVKPTAEGVTLYRKALAILDDVDTTCQDIRRMGVEHARAPRMGLVQTSRKYGFLQTAIAAFRAEMPRAGIEFDWGMSADLAASLSERRLDVTLMYGRRHGSQHFNERLIHREKIILAVHPAHRLAGHGPLDLAELADEPLIWLSRRDNADTHDETLQHCRLRGLEPLIAHTAHSHVEQIDLTIVNAAICLVPSTTVLTVPEGVLMFRPLSNFDAELRLSLAWRMIPAGHVTAKLLSALHAAIDGHRQEITSDKASWARLDSHRVTIVD